MRKIKLIIFILLIISFVIVLFFSIFGTSLSFLSSKEIKENRKLKEDLISELKINNVDAIYDKNNNIYYYMVSENYANNMYVLNLDLDNKFKYKIIGEALNVIKVDYSKPIKVIIYNDKYYYETKIQLTNLPLINITSEEEITANDTNTIFTYINTELTEKVATQYSKMHIRGASSTLLDKKSYKINFYDKKYKSEKEVIISDFYYGNSLILDAIYRDPSKVRNVLSTQLWNDISNDFDNVNIYSEFVEVFINNEYMGIYVFTEPINRRRLALEKSNSDNSSVIIKSIGWNTVGTNTDFEEIYSDTYIDYEIKYPNNEELYSDAWYNFLNKISNYYNPKVKKTSKIINNTFNNKNYIDITILNSFINNIDSCLIYNQYFYMKSFDSKVYIQPWDMEFSFGYHDSRRKEEYMVYDYIVCDFYHENAPEINELLIARYWELRKNILTKEYFDKLLDNYKNKLNKGAASRDSKLWYEYDIEKEIEEIRTWIYNRLDYFDSYIKELENE